MRPLVRAIISVLLSISCAVRHHSAPQSLDISGETQAPLMQESSNYLTYIDPALIANLEGIYVVDNSFALTNNNANKDLDSTTKEIIAGSVIGSIVLAGGIFVAVKLRNHGELATRPQVVPPAHDLGPRLAAEKPRLVAEKPSAPSQGDYGKKADVPAVLPEKAVPLSYEPLTSLENFHFKKGEGTAVIKLSTTDDFVKKLEKSPGKSLIIHNTEFRLFKTDRGQAYLYAIDVSPKMDRERVVAAYDRGEIYLPSATLRSDKLFPLKKEAVRRFGMEKIAIQVNATGTLKGDPPIQYTVGEGMLGLGENAYVMRVSFESGTEKFTMVVKVPNDSGKEYDALSKGNMQNEIIALDGMARHPNALQFYGAFPLQHGRYAMAMEDASGDWMDLVNLVRRDKKVVPFADKTRLIIGTADAVAAMHSSSYAHCDIKPNNLFYASITDSSTRMARLGDFGSARKITHRDRLLPMDYYGVYSSPHIQKAAHMGETKLSGDFNNEHQPFGNPFAEDVFALGISILEFRTSKEYSHLAPKSGKTFASPTTGEQEQQLRSFIAGEEVFKAASADVAFSDLKNEEKELLRRMVSDDPTKRPSMQEVADAYRAIYPL